MPAELTPEQRDLRDAALLFGRTFGLGGSLWTVKRSGGDSITAPAGPVTIGTITGYVRKIKPTQLAQALAGATTAKATWKLVAELGDPVDPADLAAEDLLANDELISQADAAYRFTIKDIDMDGGYVAGILGLLR